MGNEFGSLGIEEAEIKDKLRYLLKVILKAVKVDWDFPKLKVTKFPAIVNVDTRVVQVHYMF